MIRLRMYLYTYKCNILSSDSYGNATDEGFGNRREGSY
jgi:hypothetical protein